MNSHTTIDPSPKEPTSAQRRRSARRRRRIVVAGVVAAAVLIAGGAGAYALANPSGPEYRTATAQTGTVTQQTSGTGSIGSATNDQAAFQVAGTVAGVNVKVGDTVTAGATLATLDPATLDDAVTAAQQTLADDQETLASDLAAQAAGTSSTSSSSSSKASGTGSASTGTSNTGSSGTGTAGTGTAGTGSAATDPTGTETSSSGTSGAGTAGSGSSGDQGGSTSTPSSSPTTSNPSAPSGDSEAVQKAIAAVTKAQQDMLAQYDVVKQLLDTSAANGDASTVACADFLAAVFPTSTGATDPTTAPTDPATSDPTDTPTPDPSATDPATADSDATGTGADTSGASATVSPAAYVTIAKASTSSDDDQAAALQAIKDSLVKCQTAIATAQGGQSDVATAQTTLLDKAAALNTATAALQKAIVDQSATGNGSNAGNGSSSGSGSGSTSSSTGSSGDGASATHGTSSDTGTTTGTGAANGATSGTGSTGGTATTSGTGQSGSGSSATVTAEQILADQAQIALDEANVSIAQQSRAAATLTSKIDGTVVAVNVAAGDAVTAGEVAVVIEGGTGFLVTMTLPLTTVKELAVGDAATFAAGSTKAALTGKVSAIGITNVSSNSVPSFTVTLSVDQKDAELYDGASVRATITVAQSDGVVTIPTSALHVSGTETTVQVDKDGTLSDLKVTTGAVGSELTEIKEGLAVGDEVVLADMSKDVTSESTSSTTSNRTRTGTGSFPAGGSGGGTFTFNVSGGAPVRSGSGG